MVLVVWWAQVLGHRTQCVARTESGDFCSNFDSIRYQSAHSLGCERLSYIRSGPLACASALLRESRAQTMSGVIVLAKYSPQEEVLDSWNKLC